MSEHGAALQNYNQELVKCVESMKVKLSAVNESLNKDAKEKAKLEEEINELSKRLDAINSKIKKKNEISNNLEQTIQRAESAYIKILDSSQALLNMVKKESELLDEV